MRRVTGLLLIVLLFFGCSKEQNIDNAIAFRQALISSGACFQCTVHADYGDTIHSFIMQCSFDTTGAMNFSVIKPDSIAGITGNIATDRGYLTFDQQHLLFPLLADGYISPVSAPWLMIRTLRGGYIHGCTKTEEGFRITLDDSYGQQPLQVDVWTDEQGHPQFCEMLWKGRRILSLEVTDFCYV